MNAYIDTNIILRHILNDHPDHSARAKSLLQMAERGELTLIVPTDVVDEVVFVLESQGYATADIYNALLTFSHIKGVKLSEHRAVLDALVRFRDHEGRIDWVDCLLAARSHLNRTPVYTFNKKHFERFPITWFEPPR